MPISVECEHRRAFFAKDEDYVSCAECDARKPSVIQEVAAERKRQIEVEGWSVSHDDEHYNGEMAAAAASYAIADQFPGYAEKVWPWDSIWWKPTTDRRNLVKAAALIIAEIERLDRIHT